MPSERARRLTVVLATIALPLVVLPFVLFGSDRHAQDAPAAHAEHHRSMSDAEMRQWVEDWFATNPEVGRSTLPQGGAAATIEVRTNFFDLDGSPATVDTAKILVGESVLWQWFSGTHTVTNGTGFADPQAGNLFDVPSGAAAPTFQFTFNDPGLFPYFCRPHEFANMRGFVLVQDIVGVGPAPSSGLGFTTRPSPNPSATGVRFGFTVREAGNVRAEIYDAQGRNVATVVDASMGPGAYTAAWNGRARDGSASQAGIYYVRLRLPGYDASRRVVITR